MKKAPISLGGHTYNRENEISAAKLISDANETWWQNGDNYDDNVNDVDDKEEEEEEEEEEDDDDDDDDLVVYDSDDDDGDDDDDDDDDDDNDDSDDSGDVDPGGLFFTKIQDQIKNPDH